MKYGDFFSTLDAAVNTSADLTYDLLAQLFWEKGLRRYKVAISFFIRRNLLREMKANEWTAYLQGLNQRRFLSQVRGAPDYQVLIQYNEFMQGHVRRNRKLNWVTPKERPKPRTVTNNLRAAHHFLTFAGFKTGDDPRMLHQNIVDSYLFEHRGYRNAIRPFIWYLNKIVRIFKPLSVPTEEKGIRENLILPDDKVSDLLVSWLASEGQESRAAIMGLLMLLYCQQPHTIAPIKLRDIQLSETNVTQITIGNIAIAIVPEVGQVLRRYLEIRKTLCISERAWENPFLFPGQLARSHIDPSTISRMMNKFMVSAEQLFATSVSNAFADGVPSPNILVKTVGITLPTAMKYFYAQNPMQANYVNEHLSNK